MSKFVRPLCTCPEAANLLLAENYDFGVNVSSMDDLSARFEFGHIYDGAKEYLPSNGERQRYRTPDWGCHRIANGMLSLVARPMLDNNGGPIIASAMIRTKTPRQFGFWEARIYATGGPTIWPAVWLYPANKSWPPEIDWFDSPVNADPTRETSHMIHLGAVTADGQAETISESKLDQWSNFYLPPAGDWRNDFVVIGGLWTADHLVHYVDGVAVRRSRYPWRDSHGNDPGPAYTIINLAIGGTWPGQPTRATFGTANEARLDVDYLRIWA